MNPPMSMRTFLLRARETLQQRLSSRARVSFVIGNESAGIDTLYQTLTFNLLSDIDLDSVTSALIYGYLRSLKSYSSDYWQPCIPLLNIPSKDVKLRRELLALLPQAGLDQESLLTLDDLSPDGIAKPCLEPELADVTLVDENVLRGPLAKDYGHRVVGIVDHHVDQRQRLADNAAGPRIVVKCGSCTSLVVNFWRDDWNALFPPSTTKDNGGVDTTAAECSVQAATLALASILVDTNNLTEVSKTTEADLVAAEFLKSKVPPSFDGASFFAGLQRAKQGIDGLSLEEVLRKDFKQWSAGEVSIGISGIVRSLSYLAHELQDRAHLDSSFAERAREFARSRSLDVYMIMTAHTNAEGDFQRDLFVCGLSQRGVEAARKFIDQHGRDLDLGRLEGDWSNIDEPSEYQRVFKQRALHQSRKQVAPMMNDLVTQLSSRE
jgi:exopolyphosphatase